MVEFLAVLFFLAIWTYAVRACALDARRRGRDPVLIASLVGLTFPFGLVIWLFSRPDPLDSPKPEKPFEIDDFRVQ